MESINFLEFGEVAMEGISSINNSEGNYPDYNKIFENWNYDLSGNTSGPINEQTIYNSIQGFHPNDWPMIAEPTTLQPFENISNDNTPSFEEPIVTTSLESLPIEKFSPVNASTNRNDDLTLDSSCPIGDQISIYDLIQGFYTTNGTALAEASSLNSFEIIISDNFGSTEKIIVTCQAASLDNAKVLHPNASKSNYNQQEEAGKQEEKEAEYENPLIELAPSNEEIIDCMETEQTAAAAIASFERQSASTMTSWHDVSLVHEAEQAIQKQYKSAAGPVKHYKKNTGDKRANYKQFILSEFYYDTLKKFERPFFKNVPDASGRWYEVPYPSGKQEFVNFCDNATDPAQVLLVNLHFIKYHLEYMQHRLVVGNQFAWHYTRAYEFGKDVLDANSFIVNYDGYIEDKELFYSHITNIKWTEYYRAPEKTPTLDRVKWKYDLAMIRNEVFLLEAKLAASLATFENSTRWHHALKANYPAWAWTY